MDLFKLLEYRKPPFDGRDVTWRSLLVGQALEESGRQLLDRESVVFATLHLLVAAGYYALVANGTLPALARWGSLVAFVALAFVYRARKVEWRWRGHPDAVFRVRNSR